MGKEPFLDEKRITENKKKQKNNHNIVNTSDILINKKDFESLWSAIVISAKKWFFILIVTHADPLIMSKYDPKSSNF